MIFSTKIFTMGKVACYNALKPPGGEMFGREKAGKRQAGTAGCRGRSASWREGRTSYKIKDWGWRVAFWPASPKCRLFYTDKRLFRLCNVDLYCSGVFLSDRRHASGDCLCKEPCCFFFVGAADENFAAVDEMEGIAHKRKDFRGVYPKALVAVDKGMLLQSGQKLLGRLSSEDRIVELDYLCLMSCPLQI